MANAGYHPQLPGPAMDAGDYATMLSCLHYPRPEQCRGTARAAHAALLALEGAAGGFYNGDESWWVAKSYHSRLHNELCTTLSSLPPDEADTCRDWITAHAGKWFTQDPCGCDPGICPDARLARINDGPPPAPDVRAAANAGGVWPRARGEHFAQMLSSVRQERRPGPPYTDIGEVPAMIEDFGFETSGDQLADSQQSENIVRGRADSALRALCTSLEGLSPEDAVEADLLIISTAGQVCIHDWDFLDDIPYHLCEANDRAARPWRPRPEDPPW